MTESEHLEPNEKASGISIPPALLKYKIPGLPDSFYYIANFLTEEEERVLLHEVGSGFLSFFLIYRYHVKKYSSLMCLLRKRDVYFGLHRIVSLKDSFRLWLIILIFVLGR